MPPKSAARKAAPVAPTPDTIDTEQATAQITAMVRLSALYLHPFNTRSEPPPAEIEALAESIRTVGLLQNLSGFADHQIRFRPGHQDADPAAIGIVAGGRRLRALQLLHPNDDPMVPVLVTPDADLAREWAGAENSARTALHPADEVRAYGRMADAGADMHRIAAAFGVTHRQVQGRLKLARLPQVALDALRAGHISLDQAAALTVSADEIRVAELVQDIKSSRWAVSPADIRRKLLPTAVAETDRRAVFVGLDDYQANGGAVQFDLFSGETRLLDPALLDRLFTRALDQWRADLMAEGWGAVVAWTDPYPDHGAVFDLDRLRPLPVVLPEGDAVDLERLQDIGEGREFTPAEAERFDDLTARAEAVIYDPDLMARATVYVLVNREGQKTIHCACLPAGPSTAADGDDGGTVAAKEISIPQSLKEDLAIIRRTAMQTALLQDPDLVFDLLALTLTNPGLMWRRPLSIDLTAPALAPSKPDALLISERLSGAVPEPDRTTELTPQMLTAITRQGRGAVDTLIARAVTRAFRASAPGAFADHIADLTGVDVRAIWTPTDTNYFSRLPGPLLDRLWSDLIPDDHEAKSDFFSAKKGDRAKRLHRLFNDPDWREAMHLDIDATRRIDAWLPPELRFGTVATDAGGAA